MGRNWKPKTDVRCEKCGWEGRRASVFVACPKCDHYYPQVCEDQKPFIKRDVAQPKNEE